MVEPSITFISANKFATSVSKQTKRLNRFAFYKKRNKSKIKILISIYRVYP